MQNLLMKSRVDGYDCRIYLFYLLLSVRISCNFGSGKWRIILLYGIVSLGWTVRCFLVTTNNLDNVQNMYIKLTKYAFHGMNFYFKISEIIILFLSALANKWASCVYCFKKCFTIKTRFIQIHLLGYCGYYNTVILATSSNFSRNYKRYKTVIYNI